MRSLFFKAAVAASVLLAIDTAASADDFVIDTAHSGVNFKISHLGLAYVHGRFDSFSGKFTIDSSDPAKSSFALNIKPETVDTNNMGRDTHLRGPDFFNVKQYPVISFTSTSVKPSEEGYEVTGELTLHGATKPVTFSLKGGKSAEFPAGVKRTGYSTELVLKRSEFGVGKPMPALGDDIFVSISFEGTKKG
jgi:polyisoprenoid-binding protein YceI